MKRLFTLLLLVTCFGCFSFAQNTSYKTKAEAALKKGDYETAEKQYKAYAASLNSIGKATSQQKLEKLDAEKAIAKITACKPMAEAAATAYKNAMSEVEQYNSVSSRDASKLNSEYSKCTSLLATAKKDYQSVKSKCPEDGLAASRLGSITSTISKLRTPEQRMKAVVLENPSSETVEWYVSNAKVDYSAAQALRNDVNLWESCESSTGKEQLRYLSSYLGNSSNTLFRTQAQDTYDILADDIDWQSVDSKSLSSVMNYINSSKSYTKKYLDKANTLATNLKELQEDETKWASVNKESEASLNAYINESTPYKKQYVDKAKSYLGKIAEKSKWNNVKKTDMNSLSEFMKANPNSAYYADAETLLDDLSWNNTIKTDMSSLQNYLSSYSSVKKSHASEAKSIYAKLYDQKQWSMVSVEDKDLLKSYLNDSKNTVKSHKDVAQANLDAIYAREISATQPTKAYDLLNNASRIISLTKSDKKLLSSLADDIAYNEFAVAPTLDNAQKYINSYASGSHSGEVTRWINHFTNVYNQCETWKKRISTKNAPESFNLYTYSHPYDIDEYSDYVHQQKMTDYRERGGAVFQFGLGFDGAFGIGVEDDNIPSFAFGPLAEFRIGNAIQRLSLAIGAEALINTGFVDSEEFAFGLVSASVYTSLKLNLFKTSDYSRMYIAPGVGYDFINYDIPIQVRVGMAIEHFDIGLYYRTCAFDPYANPNMEFEDGRPSQILNSIGFSFIF